MKQYLDLLERIKDEGEVTKVDRTGAGTKTIFPAYISFDMSSGKFPLLTTKRVSFKNVANELLWFLSGSDSVKPLLESKCGIWSSDALRYNMSEVVKYGLMTEKEVGSAVKEAKINANYGPARSLIKRYEDEILNNEEFSEKAGKLGPTYGPQWRGKNGAIAADQVSELEDALSAGGTSRRMMVNAWNSKQKNDVALPPCHYGYQVNVTPETKKLSLLWNQRSVDTILGLPYNLASYALLEAMLAESHGLNQGTVNGSLGNTHIYLPHMPAAEEQLKRDPMELPELVIKNHRDSVLDYNIDDFEIKGYKDNNRGPLEYPTPMFGGLF